MICLRGNRKTSFENNLSLIQNKTVNWTIIFLSIWDHLGWYQLTGELENSCCSSARVSNINDEYDILSVTADQANIPFGLSDCYDQITVLV